jgi:hypothetical protein
MTCELCSRHGVTAKATTSFAGHSLCSSCAAVWRVLATPKELELGKEEVKDETVG